MGCLSYVDLMIILLCHPPFKHLSPVSDMYEAKLEASRSYFPLPLLLLVDHPAPQTEKSQWELHLWILKEKDLRNITVNGMSQLYGSHDYSKSIILTICHHITNTYICAIPPLNICHLCQICMKPNLRPAGPISPSPLLPLLWEFTSDVELDHILPLLVPVQLHHLPPLCPFFPTITIWIWNKKFQSS